MVIVCLGLVTEQLGKFTLHKFKVQLKTCMCDDVMCHSLTSRGPGLSS